MRERHVNTTIHQTGARVTAVTPAGHAITGHVESHAQVNEFGDVAYTVRDDATGFTFTAAADKVREDGPRCVNCGTRRGAHSTPDHAWNGGGSA